MTITPITLILLKTVIKGKNREILTTPSRGDLHTELGVLHLEELAGKDWGVTISTHLGHSFVVHKPRSPDIFKHLRRSGAPLMPKDIASIIAHTGVSKDDTVLEAGTGTGILTMYLARIVKHVTSYEIRADIHENAKVNMEKLGLTNITLHNRDLLQEISNMNQEFDIIILDMPEAYNALPHILKLLRPGGYLAIYTPYIEHAKLAQSRLKEEGEVTTIEAFEREISFGEKGTRPATQKVGHTGYLTFARKN